MTKLYKIKLKNGIVKKIIEPKILVENVADERARAEFLEYGYTKQIVEFTTDFEDLNIHDIISIYAPNKRIPKALTEDRFIVKLVEHYFTSDSIKTKIKAVRYDLGA